MTLGLGSGVTSTLSSGHSVSAMPDNVQGLRTGPTFLPWFCFLRPTISFDRSQPGRGRLGRGAPKATRAGGLLLTDVASSAYAPIHSGPQRTLVVRMQHEESEQRM
jgi:hypothetical protein